MPSKHVHNCTSSVYHLLLQFISLCVTLWKWFRVKLLCRRKQQAPARREACNQNHVNRGTKLFTSRLFSHLCWRHFLFVCLVCQGTHIRGHFTASVVRVTCFIHKSVHFRLPRASITPSLSVKKNANFYTQLLSWVCACGAGFPFLWPSAFVLPATCPFHVSAPSSVQSVTRSQCWHVQDLNCSAIRAVTKLHARALLTLMLVMFMLPVFLATFCASLLHRTKA